MTTTTGSPLEYSVGPKNYRGMFCPGPSRPKAAVVLLPDWRGQSDLAFAHAARLNAFGCAVAIADLYGDGFSPTDPEQVGPMVQRLIAERSEGVAATAACVAAVRGEVPDGTPIVLLGFSAGGMVAFDLARADTGQDSAIAGVIVCSALLKTAGDGMGTRILVPVLVLQGTQDQVVPMAVINDVVAEMDAAGNDARFVLFTQTHHAFDNPAAGSDPTQRLVYSERSAERAWREIANFLAELTA